MKARGAPIDQVILDPYYARQQTHAGAPGAIRTPQRCFTIGRTDEGQSTITSFAVWWPAKASSSAFGTGGKRIVSCRRDFIGPIMDRPARYSEIFLGR
jgi:hypothetical protein